MKQFLVGISHSKFNKRLLSNFSPAFFFFFSIDQSTARHCPLCARRILHCWCCNGSIAGRGFCFGNSPNERKRKEGKLKNKLNSLTSFCSSVVREKINYKKRRRENSFPCHFASFICSFILWNVVICTPRRSSHIPFYPFGKKYSSSLSPIKSYV